MASVRDIANWFLSKEPMTHKKIQKLCYYAQAWYCALYKEGPLFTEPIQAWVHGPVAPALYPIFADYGWNMIPRQDIVPILNEKTTQLLEAVYKTYGSFSGDQLESLTHSELPWVMARGGLEPWDICVAPITCEVMTDYYGKKYAESQND